MNLVEVLNIIALIVVPIMAVGIGQWLQVLSERRKDKMQVFRTLMTARIYGWTRESVEAMNIIDVVFVNDKKVREVWKDLSDKYRVENPDAQHMEKIKQAQFKLLEEMAKSLGYKNKITWETIQNPYVPMGLSEQIQNQSIYNQELLMAVGNLNSMMSGASGSSSRPDINSAADSNE